MLYPAKLLGCGNDSLGPIGCGIGRLRLVRRGRACTDGANSASRLRSCVFCIDFPSATMEVGATAKGSTDGISSVVEFFVHLYLPSMLMARCKDIGDDK